MSITVDVGLLSGKTATVKAGLDEEVGALQRRAQIALGVGRGRLVGSCGSVLDAFAPIKHAKLENGDVLMLQTQRTQVQASGQAFAAVLGDGSVVTWGNSAYGGDSSKVQDHLKNVQQIQVSGSAFAAILGDGSVVTWGYFADGGDSSAVQDQLKNVQQIQASGKAFAAILGDGSVVTWGNSAHGGDSTAVQDQLKNVRQIQASESAFAAILGDGSVVTWGNSAYGGDSSAVQDQLKNVQQIQVSGGAFAAILGDGSVATWVFSIFGGDSSAVQDHLKNVQQIQASFQGFAAVLRDGSVVAWGPFGADSSAVQDHLKNVQQIQASRGAFAAILGDGSVVTWGGPDFGSDSSAVWGQLKNVQQIQASSHAFAAILGDGSVVTWGNSADGGDSSAVQDQLKNVQQIQASYSAFAAILGDGSVVTWGNAAAGGDSRAVQDQLKNVQQIQASSSAFAAILDDGSVVTWGNSAHGGDSSAVQDQLKNCAADPSMYLKTARVKCIDTKPFPTAQYKPSPIPGSVKGKLRLLREYYKLCFQVPGTKWRTFLTLFIDQFKNGYNVVKLLLNLSTAVLVGCFYVLPMVAIHIGGIVKVQMDLPGQLRLFLQCCLFRKYLNYSEESRASVVPSDMQTAITNDAGSCAAAYSKLLDLIAVCLELIVFTYFTLDRNPAAIVYIIAMPACMVVYVAFVKSLCRKDVDAFKAQNKLVLRIVAEVCERYRLVADYFQRPQMNEGFATSAASLRQKQSRKALANLNDDMFPQWLGPGFTALYISFDATNVLNGQVTLGTFLATISDPKEDPKT
ncbi:hypothetical protein AK812_SmicGene16400 [Symbiodinium microadriaticum]|uniref:E3 ubiquitin-protein ligase HERC1 n=1 Tax=Symbiodinium microadriaticum TaxID=2951 RepID=A0A1Q9E0D0_SYMMI|nr:hypothetical protein AK812_SmicGene16400 [Symbiodinium microadriaticum]